MRTPPKNRFLFSFALAALGCAGLALLGAMPLEAAPRHARIAKTDPKAVAAPAAAPAAPPAADADSEENDPDENGVAAVVNEVPVTEYDLRQRLALVLSTSGMQATSENMKRMRSQVLEQLKTESLELQEARRKNITVSPPEVDKEIDGILNDNHLTMDQLKQILGRNSVAIETLRSQIAIQLAWQKAIEDEYGDRINITEDDVKDELARAKEGADKMHYLVAEIFLPIDSPDQNEKVLKSANDLETQLQGGASFPTIARQFSQSPSAAAGGDLGWVHDGQLSDELNEALRKTSPGSITPPIRGTGGYYILALRQRQAGEGTKVAPVAPPPPPPVNPHPGYLPLARFLLPMPPKAPKEYIDKVIAMASNIRGQITSCAQLQKISAGLRGSVFMNLGEIKLSDLSPEIQAALAQTQSGESTTPLKSSAGIEVIARCDKLAAKPEEQLAPYKTPSSDEIERRLFQQQISMLARRYIRDLRRQANVETR